MPEFDKLDTGLIMALRAHKASGGVGHADDGISVSLRFEGDLAAIEVPGFERHMVSGDDALGVVRFKDIAALVEHPGVICMAAGRPRRVNLDTAASDIRARASAPISGALVDGLWHRVVAGSGASTSAANASGKDVIVAMELGPWNSHHVIPTDDVKQALLGLRSPPHGSPTVGFRVVRLRGHWYDESIVQ